MSATVTDRSSATGSQASEFVMSVRDLKQHFPLKEGILQRVTGHVRAVDGVSFDIRRGETIGLVGESGCGKTTLGRCIAGLIEPTSGGLYFGLDREERDRLDALQAMPSDQRSASDDALLTDLDAHHRIDAMSKERRREYRRNCQVVFQDAFSSLNPRHLVKDIVGRPLRIYDEASGSDLNERVVGLLESVGLSREHLYRYPHQFSGGQRQRISIARALALDPQFLVLDEPTSALDVSVQAQILNLLHGLQQEHGLTYLFITHDLSVVRHMSDRAIVMYLGKVCEIGSTSTVLADPQHAYTQALLAADPDQSDEEVEPVRLEGSVPDPAHPPEGCRFHTRCPVATSWCGWEVDDIVERLERLDTDATPTRIERTSPFEADLEFDSADQAAGMVRLLETEAPQAMRDALELRHSGDRVAVRFREVEPVRLEEVAPGHDSACVLYTSQHPVSARDH